ncbi:MAG: PEGA domain-containing protein, partial [Polyangia bacterium]
AAIVVVPLARRSAPATTKDEPHVVIEPVVRPLETDKALGSDKPVDRPLDTPAEGDVRVVSEPSGAQVYAGPKLVGTAPVTLHLARGGALPVTLVHAGFEDLNYTVQSGDGPALTLRLVRHRRNDVVTHKSAPPPSTPAGKDKGARKTHVDTFDDGEKPPHVPKVQAIDD